MHLRNILGDVIYVWLSPRFYTDVKNMGLGLLKFDLGGGLQGGGGIAGLASIYRRSMWAFKTVFLKSR